MMPTSASPILNPNAKLAAGYQPLMPPHEGRITDEQIDQIAAYLKSL